MRHFLPLHSADQRSRVRKFRAPGTLAAMEARNPAEVIRRVLAVVPVEEDELRAQLEKIAQDSWFFPPEGQQPIWASLRNVLLRRFPEPTSGWPMTVSNIVRGIEQADKPKAILICIDHGAMKKGELVHQSCSVKRDDQVCPCDCQMCKRAWWAMGRPRP